MTENKLDEFETHYAICAIWASLDHSRDDDSNSPPLDENYSISNLSDEAIERIKEDCKNFREKAGDLIDDKYMKLYPQYSALEMAAHDFWLTRNGHGAGFLDGDWEREVGKKLTEIAKEFGGCDLYAGDDEKLYFFS